MSLAGRWHVHKLCVAEDFALAGFGQDDEFVRKLAADGSRVRAHRHRFEAHARKRIKVAYKHLVVSLCSAFKIKIGKGVRRLPVIAISGGFDPGGADNFLSDTVFGIGADAALPKPIDLEELRSLIEEMTSERDPTKLAP